MSEQSEIPGSGNGDEMRLWNASEARRHAETALCNQQRDIENLRGRATSLLGWASAGALATAALWKDHPVKALLVELPIIASGVACLRVLWPRNFREEVPHPKVFLYNTRANKLDTLTALVKGLIKAIDENDRKKDGIVTALRCAYATILFAPLIAMVTSFL